jgi:hypothetical protein
MILDKKVTRKEFLLSALSIATLFVASKVPSIAKDFTPKKEGNTYGNYSYGGGKKNA